MKRTSAGAPACGSGGWREATEEEVTRLGLLALTTDAVASVASSPPGFGIETLRVNDARSSSAGAASSELAAPSRPPLPPPSADEMLFRCECCSEKCDDESIESRGIDRRRSSLGKCMCTCSVDLNGSCNEQMHMHMESMKRGRVHN